MTNPINTRLKCTINSNSDKGTMVVSGKMILYPVMCGQI